MTETITLVDELEVDSSADLTADLRSYLSGSKLLERLHAMRLRAKAVGCAVGDVTADSVEAELASIDGSYKRRWALNESYFVTLCLNPESATERQAQVRAAVEGEFLDSLQEGLDTGSFAEWNARDEWASVDLSETVPLSPQDLPEMAVPPTQPPADTDTGGAPDDAGVGARSLWQTPNFPFESSVR